MVENSSPEMPADNETRIVITADMLSSLKNEVAQRGGPASMRLARLIRDYEKKHSKPPTKLTHIILYSVLVGRTHTIAVDQWQRLNEVLQSLPVFILRERIELTPQMMEDLKTKLLLHGDIGPNPIMRAIDGYETGQNVPSVGFTSGILKWLLQGKLKNLHAARWDRLHDVLDQLPVDQVTEQDREKIDLTEKMVDALKDKITAKGGYGADKLAHEVARYDRAHGKENIELSRDIIFKIISRINRKVLVEQWGLLNDVLDALPDDAKPERLPLTKETLAGAKNKIAAAGGFGYTRLMQEVERYEAIHQMVSAGITVKIIQKILYHNLRTVDARQWRRLVEVIDNIPNTLTHTSPSIASASVVGQQPDDNRGRFIAATDKLMQRFFDRLIPALAEATLPMAPRMREENIQTTVPGPNGPGA